MITRVMTIQNGEREREEVIIFVGENICRQRKQYKMGRERGSDDNTKWRERKRKYLSGRHIKKIGGKEDTCRQKKCACFRALVGKTAVLHVLAHQCKNLRPRHIFAPWCENMHSTCFRTMVRKVVTAPHKFSLVFLLCFLWFHFSLVFLICFLWCCF